MKKKGIYPAAVLLLAFGLCLMRPVVSGAVEGAQGAEDRTTIALDTDKCSLTVEAIQPDAGEERKEDLKKADIVVDLYLVATAEKTPGVDTYFYKQGDFYEGLAFPEEIKESDWESLAQEAVVMALDPEHPDTPVKTVKPGEKLEGLSGGLYLMVARGRTMENYTEIRKDAEGKERVVTLAASPLSAYTFSPQLVSLPMKDPTADGQVSTANPGDWIYDVTVYLKPVPEDRYGSLEIVKTLRTYETKEPGIFVFQIEAVLGGETVYSDVESLIFTEAGQQTIRIENKIPAGAAVTVTEIYEGGTYELESAKEQTVQIAAEDFVRAEFVNDYTEDRKGGHGIINEFDYTGSGEFGGWSWKSDPAREAE